jgi:hypothetical protein
MTQTCTEDVHDAFVRLDHVREDAGRGLRARSILHKALEQAGREGIPLHVVRDEMCNILLQKMILTHPFRPQVDLRQLDLDMLFLDFLGSRVRELSDILGRARTRVAGSPVPLTPPPEAASSES